MEKIWETIALGRVHSVNAPGKRFLEQRLGGPAHSVRGVAIVFGKAATLGTALAIT